MTEETKELLCAFARLSHMHLSVYNREFHSVFSSFDPKESRLCVLLHRSPKTTELCIASDRSARETCLKTKRLYAYRCPFGLFEAIVPFYVCGELNGFLLAGKSLVEDGESAVTEAIEPFLKSEDRQDAQEALARIKRHPASELEDLCRILQALADRLAAMGGLSDGGDTIAGEVRQYLRKNLQSPLTLTDLAINFHCSTVTLSKWYYREYEKTIMEDLLSFRMERAKTLLTETEQSVTVIAEACGYSDGGYFSKCFRAYTGMSPSDWRRKSSSPLL